jgi:hypothetical protein
MEQVDDQEDQPKTAAAANQKLGALLRDARQRRGRAINTLRYRQGTVSRYERGEARASADYIAYCIAEFDAKDMREKLLTAFREALSAAEKTPTLNEVCQLTDIPMEKLLESIELLKPRNAWKQPTAAVFIGLLGAIAGFVMASEMCLIIYFFVVKHEHIPGIK